MYRSCRVAVDILVVVKNVAIASSQRRWCTSMSGGVGSDGWNERSCGSEGSRGWGWPGRVIYYYGWHLIEDNGRGVVQLPRSICSCHQGNTDHDRHTYRQEQKHGQTKHFSTRSVDEQEESSFILSVLASVCDLWDDGLGDVDFGGPHRHSYRQLSGRRYQCRLQQRRGVQWIIGITRRRTIKTVTAVTSTAIVFVLKEAVAFVILF